MGAGDMLIPVLNIPLWNQDVDGDGPFLEYYSPIMGREREPSLYWNYFPHIVRYEGHKQTSTQIEIMLYMENGEDENTILEEAIRTTMVALDCRQTLIYLCALPLGIPTADHTLFHLPQTDYYCVLPTMHDRDVVFVHESFDELNRIFPALNNSI